MKGLEARLGRLGSLLWRIIGIGFAIVVAGFIVVFSQGGRNPTTATGRVAVDVLMFVIPTTGVLILAGFFLNLTRIVLRLRSGRRFSDVDLRHRD